MKWFDNVKKQRKEGKGLPRDFFSGLLKVMLSHGLKNSLRFPDLT